MLRRMGLLALVIAVLALPAALRAAGFSIFEAGGKALGMGGAFAAQADDPSAMFFNPAGLADLKDRQVYFGATLIGTGTSFAGIDPDPGYGVDEKTGVLLFVPINGYLTWELQEGLTAGLGIYNPFGLGQDWEGEAQFTGRHIAQQVLLRTVDVNPTIAWRAHEKFSIGVGLQAVYGDVDLDRYLQLPDPNGSGLLDIGTLNLHGKNTFDYGFTAGVLVDASEDVALAVSYRSGVTLELEGDAKFVQQPSGNPAFDPAVTSQFPRNQVVSTTVELPDMITIGAAYKGVESWIFEVDAVIFRWSVFEDLPFNFAFDPSLSTVRPQNYDDTVQIRTGAQYTLSEETDLRFGYYFDPTPQNNNVMSPFLADGDRHGVTAGLGHDLGKWHLDAFVLALITSTRSTEDSSLDGYNGDYKSFGYLGGVNLGFGF